MSNAVPFELPGPVISYPKNGSGGIDIFVCKANIWIVICSQATASIVDTQTDVIEKVSTFLKTEKILT